MRQELVDDAAMVQAVLGRVTLQIGRQQAPGFICGAARQLFPLGTRASSPCHCLRGHGVLQGTCPAARVQRVR